MNITVLHSNNFSPNEISFLYPLFKYKNELKEYGTQLLFTQDIHKIDSDVCMLSSKFFSTVWSKYGVQSVLDALTTMRKKAKKIIWYDVSDSTGTTHFNVLPYVDVYLKNQILSDKKNYLKKYYGARIYSDFMHHHFNIEDTDPDEEHLNYIPQQNLLDKVSCGWNSGLAYFGKRRSMQNYFFTKYPATLKLFNTAWVKPDHNKSIAISCRLGTQYNRATIARSRQMIISQLQSIIPTNKLSHRAYYKELKQSIAALCPFGLGEISLRDFEVVINGVAMIKQDMSHVETWPNLWIKESTYLDFKWDLNDLSEKVQFAIDNPLKMRDYAYAAQNIYKELLVSKEAAQIFCKRFNELVNQ